MAPLHPLDEAARARPEQVLLEVGGERWTSAAMRDGAARVAAQLAEDGAHAGELLALPAAPTAAFVLTLHAIQWLGAIPLPIDATAPRAHIEAIRAAAGTGRFVDPLLPAPSITPIPATDVAAEAPFLALATSGTTGTPKVIRLTRRQVIASAEAAAERLGTGPAERWLCCLPFHHVGGISILYRCVQQTSTAVVHPFEPASIASALDSGGINQVSLVPTQLARVLDARPLSPFPKSLRCILLGGAPASPALLDRCREIQAPVALTWGMSETASQVATRIPGDTRAAPDVGLPLPGHSVEIEEGFLVVVGPVAPGGRYRTADRGHLDSQGRVVVAGRGADLIVSGGENIDPVSIERVLLAQEGVEDAAIIGVADPTWGQRPVAVCVGAGSHIDDRLRQALAKTLPRFAIPDAIVWVNTLPRTSAGKLDRQRVAAQQNGW